MTAKYGIALLCLLTVSIQSALAQGRFTTTRIDSVAKQLGTAFIQQNGRVGLSIGIFHDGKTHFYNFGSIRKGENVTPDPYTVYEIGSVSKTFTSFLLAQAVVEGKAKLEDDVRIYLDGPYDNLSYEGKPIRLVHLANTTSALPDNLPDLSAELQRATPDSIPFLVEKRLNRYTQQDFLADLRKAKLDYAPGVNPRHSNVAAQLLGYILERIYHKPYEALVQEYIEKPLAMNTSANAEKATGYNQKGIPMPPFTMKILQAAGGLRYSTDDMLNYVAFHLNEANRAVALSHQVTWGHIDQVGIGFNWTITKTVDSKRRLRQSGGTFGFSSYCDLYPDQRLGLVLLMNESDRSAQDQLQEVSAKLAEVINGVPPALKALQAKLLKQGYINAFAVVNQVRKQYPELHLSEDYVNNWGYALIGEGKLNQALEIFKLNVQLYPKNFNTYDSLAETYERLGNVELAIKNYRQALALNPESTNAIEHLKKLTSK